MINAEMSQRWRTVGDAVSDLAGQDFEPKIFRPDRDVVNHYTPLHGSFILLNIWEISNLMMISSFLSSCLNKATEALCIGQIRTRLESPLLTSFRLNFVSDFSNLLLVRFHRAGIITEKHLIQRQNHKAWVRVEPSTLRSWPL